MLIEIKKKDRAQVPLRFPVFYSHEENSSITNSCYKLDLYVGGGATFLCIN